MNVSSQNVNQIKCLTRYLSRAWTVTSIQDQLLTEKVVKSLLAKVTKLLPCKGIVRHVRLTQNHRMVERYAEQTNVQTKK